MLSHTCEREWMSIKLKCELASATDGVSMVATEDRKPAITVNVECYTLTKVEDAITKYRFSLSGEDWSSRKEGNWIRIGDTVDARRV